MEFPLTELLGYILLAVLAVKGLGLCSQRPNLVRRLKRAIVVVTIFMAGVRVGVGGAFLDTVIEHGLGSAYKSVVTMLWVLPLILLGCGIAAFVLVLLQQNNKNVAILGAIASALGWVTNAIDTYGFVVATGPEVSLTLSDVSFASALATVVALTAFVVQLINNKQAVTSDRLPSSK